MRQTHGAGEKLFVDYAGDTVTVVVDRLNDKTRQAHLFVAVLGASSLSYAEARWTETLPDWLGCHVNALEAFGGAPALFVPDNAKVAVIKACRYDPQVNRSYAGMADHYGSSVLPTRPRRPRDVRAVRIIFTDPALTWVLIGVLDRTEFGDRRILSPNRIRGHRGAFFAFFLPLGCLMITKHCDGPLSRLVAPRVDQHVPRRVTAAADRTQIGSAFFVFSKQARLAFFDLSIAQTCLRHCKLHRQFTLARWPFHHRDECGEQLEVCWPDDWVDIRRLNQVELV
jgi:hypothetical protein